MRISMDISVYLLKYQGEKIEQLEYSQIIKNLMYVINWTRFRIAYLVSKLSKILKLSKNRSLENNTKGTQIFEVHHWLWAAPYWLYIYIYKIQFL